jgi:hypothetical protein
LAPAGLPAYVWLFHANKAASRQVGAGFSSNITMRIAWQHDADSQETSLYQHRCERLTLPGGGLFRHRCSCMLQSSGPDGWKLSCLTSSFLSLVPPALAAAVLLNQAHTGPLLLTATGNRGRIANIASKRFRMTSVTKLCVIAQVLSR